MATSSYETQNDLHEFIIENDHPCVMAQSIVRGKNFTELSVEGIFDKGGIHNIYTGLGRFVELTVSDKRQFSSFILHFKTPAVKSELEFETALWALLDKLQAIDNAEWDSSVSANPADDNFSFSLHGTAFYIIGMHPHASRPARKTLEPMIVFNLHSQFETLREMNIYESTRDRIRERDMEQNGSSNPMLDDFGNSSEAKQYSGRSVASNWKCPFQPIKN